LKDKASFPPALTEPVSARGRAESPADDVLELGVVEVTVDRRPAA